jgi:hypothetical protein
MAFIGPRSRALVDDILRASAEINVAPEIRTVPDGYDIPIKVLLHLEAEASESAEDNPSVDETDEAQESAREDEE